MNSWEYSVVSVREQLSLDSIIRLSFNIAANYGYSPINSRSGLIDGILGGTFDRFAFSSLEQVVSLLSENGGLVNLWNGVTDISLAFDGTRSRTIPESAHMLSETNTLVETRLVVEASAFRSSSPYNRNLMAHDAECMFTDLCQKLSSPYGYSYSESAYEALCMDVDILTNIREYKPPVVLFWLQYLSSSYARLIDVTTIEQLGGKFESAGNGITMRFFDAPWLAELSKLISINKRWGEIHISE